ncbi:MFS transporter [Patescibacteria group bacterium]|nr:MFS transporter [Patescibacteria group bacterium]MBU4512795.1 MFS transporter [Patescibacteria group bacterium]
MQKSQSKNQPPQKQAKSHLKLFVVFGFVLAVANALSAYVHSSYLSQFVGEKNVGFVFTVAHFLVFLMILNYTKFINWLKIFKASIAVFLAMIVCLISLGLSNSIAPAIISFLAYVVFLNLVWISFDIYVEHFSRDEITGRIRGTYMTGLHIAWFLSPLATGQILKKFNYSFLYLIASVLVFLVMIGFYVKFKDLKVNHFPKPHFLRAIKKIYKNNLLNGIFIIAFLLHAFYCAFIVYAPIYLTKYLGFQWHQVGIMFTVMLSTFVLFTYPAGWLADKYLGEKELLTIGIFIMGVSAIVFGLADSTSFWVWLIILVCTRIGASLVEIMRDTYFFKRVDVKDIHIINLFRNTGPLAYVITPLLATLVLHFFGFQYIFVLAGVLVLTGLWFSARIKDTL